MKNNTQNAAHIWGEFLKQQPEELRALAIDVAAHIGGEISADDLRELKQVADHGAACAAVTGFLYYRETVEFFETNRADIFAQLRYDADSLGESLFSLVAGLRCFKDESPDDIAHALYVRDIYDDLTHIYNGLTWYALESVAYQLCEYLYDNDIDINKL